MVVTKVLLCSSYYLLSPISLDIYSISTQSAPAPGRKKSYYYLLKSECHRCTGAHFFNAMRPTKFETIPCTHRPDARASLTINSNQPLDDLRLRVQVVYVISVCSVLVCLLFLLSLSEAKNSDTSLYSFLPLTGAPSSNGHFVRYP